MCGVDDPTPPGQKYPARCHFLLTEGSGSPIFLLRGCPDHLFANRGVRIVYLFANGGVRIVYFLLTEGSGSSICLLTEGSGLPMVLLTQESGLTIFLLLNGGVWIAVFC